MGQAVLRAVRDETQRTTGVSLLLVAAGCAVAAAGMLGDERANVAGATGAAMLFVAAILVRRPQFTWGQILGALVLVILFIPLRRYMLPGDAGFKLEPYRLLVALIVAGWGASLLADRRVTLRASGLEAPVGAVVVATMTSILANPGRASALQPTVLKAVTFLFSFLVVFYLIVSVVRSRTTVDTIVKTLVAGGAVVAFFAVLEARIGFTPFSHLERIIPILQPDPSFGIEIDRGGATRAVGSAEHPIALSAVLVMLVPLAIYVVHTAGPRWYLPLVMILVGVLSSVSRTGVVMLLFMGIVFLCLRPKETRRLWPVIVPLLVVTHFAVPGTLGALHQAFLPEGGLITEQQGMAGSCDSSGRVADLGPTLGEIGKRPFLGLGYGTRIVTGPDANGCILDNQWLGTLVDVGLAGFLAWLWLLSRAVHRFGGAGKHDESPRGWLLVAVAASVTAYGVGCLTFDALGFSQVTFVLFLILGIGAATLMNPRESPDRRHLAQAR